MPRMSCFRVVWIRFATAVCARPWCDSPQPTRPPAVVTLTTTASRLMAVPMPSATRFSGGTGNDVGKALISTILRSALIEPVPGFRVDEISRPLAREHTQGFLGGRRAHVLARLL